MPRVIVIDDEAQTREMLYQMLEQEGYEVIVAQDGIDGIKQFRDKPADLVITDLIMPEKEGLEIIQELKNDFPEVKIIAITGGGIGKPGGYLKIAKIAGADYVFCKPLERQELLDAILEALD